MAGAQKILSLTPLSLSLSLSLLSICAHTVEASETRQQRPMPGAEQPKAGDEHLRHRESGPALEVRELRSFEIREFRVALKL